MARTKRKGKGGRTDNRKDTRRGIPWGRVITGIIIVAAAAAYTCFNYGTISRPPGERARDAYRKPRSSTIRLYFADAQGERLVAEQRSVTEAVSLEERIETAVKELLKGPRGSLGALYRNRRSSRVSAWLAAGLPGSTSAPHWCRRTRGAAPRNS